MQMPVLSPASEKTLEHLVGNGVHFGGELRQLSRIAHEHQRRILFAFDIPDDHSLRTPQLALSRGIAGLAAAGAGS